MHSTQTAMTTPPLQARRVQFDLSTSPLHWLPNDPFASHLINGIHMILPAGEFWFCRVFNQALPLITDEPLKAEVQGFIRQEAIHARVHEKGQDWMADAGVDTEAFVARMNWLFGHLLGDHPLGLPLARHAGARRQWLILRVGLVAAIEHFTGFLGQWAMDNTSWERDGHPTVADLFKWHLAEEVEHRTVAYDLYRHLCQSETGFYLSRQALMALVFPLFVHILTEGYRVNARQDRTHRASRWWARAPLPLLLLQVERTGRRNDHVPTFSQLVAATLRWLSPDFHPISEGDTEQALAYLARSPAAQAATRH